jgi:hypothetical protein
MTKRSLDQIKESLAEQFNKFRRRGDDPGPEMGGGSYGLGSVTRSPDVWSRGGKPIERPPGSTPPAASPTPSVPNVWRKGEATPRPDNPPIGGLVGKTPKKKLDEPVDLAKEFEKRSNAAPKKAQPKEPEEFSANKKDRMGRTEPTTTQNKEPELRADTRPDRIFEPSNDSSAPTWGGRVIGGVGTAGALGGAAYLWNKYKDEQNKAEKEKAYKEIYGPDAEMPVPREKPSVREPADPDNPDYENLKEEKTTKEKSNTSYTKKQYIAWAQKYSRQYDVPLSVVLHAMQKETGSYDANTAASIRGPKTKYGQAVGVMQLMPRFFPKLKPEDFTDPEKNIEAGTRALARLYNTYKDPKAALAAYNMGENRDSFREWLKTRDSKLLPKQTREYIDGNPKKGTLGYVDDPKVQIAQLDPDTTKDKVARAATDVVATLTGSSSAEAKPSKDTEKTITSVNTKLVPSDKRIAGRMENLDPEFRKRLEAALEKYPGELRVTSANRLPREQNKLYQDFINGLSKIPASKDLASHSGFAIDVDRGDLAKFHKWLQAEKKAGNDYGLETGLEWGGKARDPVHIQARSWQTIEKQRQFDKNQEQGTQVAQNKPVDKSRRQNQSADVEKKNKEKELKDRLARELAASKQFDQPSGGSAKSTPVKPEATPARPEVTPTQIAGNNKPDDTKTKAHPAGTYVQPDWSKYSYGDLGPLKKDKNGVWKTEDGKQTATDPKLIADLEKLSPAKEPSIIDKAVASLPSFLGGKDASAKSKPTPDPTTTKKDVEQPKDASSASDVERGKALDKIIRGVAGDLSGATAADKRDEYYRQQLEKAKQEKAERDKIEASKAEKKPEEPAKKVKAKKAKSTKKADQPRGGSALASAEREPDTVTIVPASPPPPPPVADKIDVKDLTTDQAGLAAVKTDTKVDQNAELVARKQAEENQRRQEAERKAAEARAQAEADRLAAQARAQQELEANRQAEIERAKKAAPIQQTAQQDSGSGFKNMWDKGIEAFTGKQRVNLRDPRITLPESINTELEEILRLAGKKTKE